MIILSSAGWKSGLREWVLQRLTAVYIAVYVVFIFLYFYFNGGFFYNTFLNLFSCSYFKIFSIVFVFSIVLHASIGLGIVITDYLKNSFLRVLLDFFVNIVLLSYVFFIMQILWGFK